jgi:aspartate carbamoyltransferase catalytic subunit
MKHLLDVDELTAGDVESILARAAEFRNLLDAGAPLPSLLDRRRVALLFAEPSTRTRLSFEIAADALGAQILVIDPGGSSLVKGESLADTARTLDALGVDTLVLRHRRAGAPWVAARHFGGSVINAGDGWHAHPTQALLDLLTLRRAFGGGAAQGTGLAGRKIVIVGDLRHSRVARSNLSTLVGAGMAVWACGPAQWLRGWPGDRTTDQLEVALDGADAVMALRVQRERMRGTAFDLEDYVARYQVTEARMRLASPGALFMHPGPVNEGVEVTHEVATGPRSLVLEQVRNGVPLRMAVLAGCQGGPNRRPG